MSQLQVKPEAMPSGGAGFLALDLRNPKDQAALRTAISDWPKRFRSMTADVHDRIVKELLVSLDEADVLTQDPDTAVEGSKLRVSASKTLAMVAQMAQRDDHKIMDAILGTGKSTTNVQVNTQVNNAPDARTVIAEMIAAGKGEDLGRLADTM